MLKIILSSLLLALGLVACFPPETEGEVKFGHVWIDAPYLPDCTEVKWLEVAPDLLNDICGKHVYACYPYYYSAYQCTAVSDFSENEAKALRLCGESLYDHEARHILEKKVHPYGSRPLPC
jgi:hypothetical protein